MIRIHASADRIEVSWLASMLEAAGITCLLRNEFLGGAIGELPINESWPEIWVVHDEDAEPARRIVADALSRPAGTGTPWQCPQCRESIEAQFSECWQCGAARPDES